MKVLQLIRASQAGAGFSADDMEKTGALNISEMQDFIPGFEMGSNPAQAQRGSRCREHRADSRGDSG